MSIAAKRFLMPAEYLKQERVASFRSEYLRGEVFAMARASFVHTLIKDNLARKIGNQLEAGPCRVLTSDMLVRVDATGLCTYPDITIVCDEPKFEDDVFDTLLNPRVVVEVLSDSTEKYDRGEKFRHYRQIESLTEYVLVSQDRPLIERFVRQEDNSWLLTEVQGLEGEIEFASVPVKVLMREAYRGVTFPSSEDVRGYGIKSPGHLEVDHRPGERG